MGRKRCGSTRAEDFSPRRAPTGARAVTAMTTSSGWRASPNWSTQGVNLAGIARILDLENRNSQLESDYTALELRNAKLKANRKPPPARRSAAANEGQDACSGQTQTKLLSFRDGGSGKLTVRHQSRLHHIGMGRRHTGTHVLLLIHDLHIRSRDHRRPPTTRTSPRPDQGLPTTTQAVNEVPRHMCTMSPDIARVGVAGFEPTASSSRTKRATKLRHTPHEASTAYRTGPSPEQTADWIRAGPGI